MVAAGASNTIATDSGSSGSPVGLVSLYYSSLQAPQRQLLVSRELF